MTLGQTSEGSELMAIGLLFNQTVICSMHIRVVFWNLVVGERSLLLS